MRHLEYIILCFLLNGCLQTFESKPVSLSSSEKMTQVQKSCHELGLLGDANSLMDQIRFDSKKLITISEPQDPQLVLSEAQEISKRIKNHLGVLTRMLDPKFTHDQYDIIWQWQVDFKSLAYLYQSESNVLWSIEKITPEAVFWMGQERPDLLSELRIESTWDHVKVELPQRLSDLSFCQLQKTLLVVLDLKILWGFELSHQKIKLIVQR